jgi:hypothetical protein
VHWRRAGNRDDRGSAVEIVLQLEFRVLRNAMNRRRGTLTRVVFCLMAMGWQAPDASPQARQKAAEEQSDFGSDSDLDRPVPAPKAAMGLIRSELQRTAEELPDKFFEASEIHLDGPNEVDLVILIPAGSHAAHFFMLRPTSGGYKIVLDSGGDSLTVLKTRSSGYRNIAVESITQAGRFTTTVSFRFNGGKYIQVSEKTRRAN